MKISNIQENLSKTELIQRLQQIMQDAARAAQDVQTAKGLERSRVAQEQVETSQETEQDRVREDGRGGEHSPERRKRKRQLKPESDSEGSNKLRDHMPPRSEGRIIDITV